MGLRGGRSTSIGGCELASGFKRTRHAKASEGISSFARLLLREISGFVCLSSR